MDADEAFFAGLSDELPSFEVPREDLVTKPGVFPYYQSDDPGIRLRQFAHRTPPFDWANDPRLPKWSRVLLELNKGEPEEPVEGEL